MHLYIKTKYDLLILQWLQFFNRSSSHFEAEKYLNLLYRK